MIPKKGFSVFSRTKSRDGSANLVSEAGGITTSEKEQSSYKSSFDLFTTAATNNIPVILLCISALDVLTLG